MSGTKFTATNHAAAALTHKVPAETAAGVKGYDTLAQALGLMSGFLFGMTLSNNGSDATNDIDIAAGLCANSTGVVLMSGGALTKRLDAAWAAGTGNGGRMSAAAIADTTYHVFAILKDSDGSVDYGFDVSATAPTMPTGYTYFRRIGSIIRASAALLSFTQRGDEFFLNTSILEANPTASGTAAVTRTLTGVPLGIAVEWYALVKITSNTAAAAVLFSSLTDVDQAASANLCHTYVAAAVTAGGAVVVRGVFTNTSAQIRSRESQADSQIVYRTQGWRDLRGRAA